MKNYPSVINVKALLQHYKNIFEKQQLIFLIGPNVGKISLASFKLVRCKLQGPDSLSPGIKHLWSNKYNPNKQAK